MGIMDEMLTEAIDGAMDNPDLEEEADEEVNKVLDEIFLSKEKPSEVLTIAPSDVLEMGPLPTVGAKENSVAIADPEINEFDRRLQELKN